jgi:glycerol-3-phosphate O-acyltransferase
LFGQKVAQQSLVLARVTAEASGNEVFKAVVSVLRDRGNVIQSGSEAV